MYCVSAFSIISFCCGKTPSGHCHSERSEESRRFETLRFAQGDKIGLPQQKLISYADARRGEFVAKRLVFERFVSVAGASFAS